MTKKKYHILAIVTVTLLITLLHFTTMRAFSPDVVLEELYYLPLLLGVLRFGLRGALVTWLFISVAYLPFLFPPWTTSFSGYVDRSLHLVLSGMIAIVVGVLVERERRNRTQEERERYLAGVGRVTTVVVHDLKNRLISILGFARRIKEGKGDSAQAVQSITASAQSMQRIVSEVLDFSKSMQLDFKEGDSRETIQRAVEICQAKAAEKSVFLIVTLPKTPIPLAMDDFHIERALVNLIDNAIDASPPGEQVMVTTSVDHTGLFVIIKDRGAGMDSAALTHIFEPFYTTKSGGTGLGMPIAKKIFEEHGGTLLVSSERDVGTDVRVWLPCGKENKGRWGKLWWR